LRFADSHCHLTDSAFDSDRDSVLERAREAAVACVVSIASDEEDALAALNLACRHDDVWCSAGVHPHSVGDSGPDVELGTIRDIASHRRCVAIGETGLDYHYDNAPRPAQRRSFSRHATLAGQVGLPLVVHSRSAEEDTAAVLREYAGAVRGVLHCFTGSATLLELAMEVGWYVSFTGIATFKSFDGDLARMVRSDRYMIETDAPYLAPVPKRGRRNEPGLVVHVAAALARMRGESLETVAADTLRNTERFFGLVVDHPSA